MNFWKLSVLLIMVLTCGRATQSQAQLPNDKLVALQFRSWDEAWRKLYPQQKQQLSWIPKAKTMAWTYSDAPFLQAMREVDQEVKRQSNDVDAVFQQYGRKATQSPSVVSRFAYGYAAWKKYIRRAPAGFREVTPAIQLMAANYVPSYQYTRVLFLLPQTYVQAPAKVFEPVGQRLLKRNPKDHYLGLEMVSLLSGIPTVAARKQGIDLLERYINEYPQEQYYKAIYASFLDRWWANNQDLASAATSPSEKQLALRQAKQDGQDAIEAYRKSIFMAPVGSEWREKAGPSLVKRITDWQKQNP